MSSSCSCLEDELGWGTVQAVCTLRSDGSWSRCDTVWRNVPLSYSLQSFCPIIAAFLITRLIYPASLCRCRRTMEPLCMCVCVCVCVRVRDG